MQEILMNSYSWIKWLHYMAFISWMAGMFYLPRLFVYHVEHADNKGFVEVVKIQEDKLFYFIQTPAMVITILTGFLMICANLSIMHQGYFHLKLLFALCLVAYNFDNYRYLKQLKANTCKKSGKFFRMYNEIPTLCLMGIIFGMIVMPLMG